MRYDKPVLIIYNVLFAALDDLARIVFLGGYPAVELVDANGEHELRSPLVDASVWEEALVHVEHLGVLVLPPVHLSWLDVWLANSQGGALTHFFYVVHVACQEVAVKFLEDLFALHAEVFQVEVRVVRRHDLDGFCSLGLAFRQFGHQHHFLHHRVLSLVQALPQVRFEFLELFLLLLYLFVLLGFFEILGCFGLHNSTLDFFPESFQQTVLVF